MLKLGAIEEITEQELNMWGGAKHYVSLHPVINTESATTQLGSPQIAASLIEMDCP